MRANIKVHLSYDGSAYHGFQIQPSAVTLQEVVEKALSRLYGLDVEINFASRTDAGVHAREQVINFWAPLNIPLERLPRALNGLLPEDVVAFHAEQVAPEFHARYSARRKVYVYTIDNGDFPDVFRRRFAWHMPRELNLEAINQSTPHLIGYRDFRCFQAAGSDIKDSHRSLYRLQVTKKGQFIYFLLEADGFLYKMARNITGTLVDIGLGRRKPSEIPQLIQKGDRSLAGPTAPARGLCLWKVIY